MSVVGPVVHSTRRRSLEHARCSWCGLLVPLTTRGRLYSHVASPRSDKPMYAYHMTYNLKPSERRCPGSSERPQGAHTFAREEMLRAAQDSGRFDVTRHRQSESPDRVEVTAKTRGRPGITLWPDGSATRNDVECHLQLKVSTIKEMREVLGLREGTA